MNSRNNIDCAYHGTINPDDEQAISELDSLSLHGLSIRNAQSIMMTDKNHMGLNEDFQECDAHPIPNPLNKTEVDTLWIKVQEQQYRQEKLRPYLIQTN